MTTVTHTARVTGPIEFTATDGHAETIPVGPVLIEQLDGQLVDIIWGPSGEESAVLPAKTVEAAELAGQLELID